MTKEIIDVIYQKTQGISDLVVKLFVGVQRRAIGKGMNDITVELIEKVWKSEFSMVNPMVEAIKSNNMVKKMQFEDIQEIGGKKVATELRETTNKVRSKLKGSDRSSIVDSRECEVRSRNKISKESAMQEKNTKIKVADLDDKDVRKIVIMGKKKGLNAYESLKESGLITTLEDLFLEVKNT